MATTTTRPPRPEHDAGLLKAATRHSAARCAALALCSVAGAGASLFLPFAIGRALDAVLAGHAAGHVGADATRWILVCTALIAVSALLDACDGVLTGTTNARTTAWLRGRVGRHVLAVGPRATARFAPGDLVARLIDNAAHAGVAPATLAALLAALVAPVGAVVALALIDAWLAVVFIAGAPVLVLLLRWFVRVSSDCVARYQQVQGDIAGRLRRGDRRRPDHRRRAHRGQGGRARPGRPARTLPSGPPDVDGPGPLPGTGRRGRTPPAARGHRGGGPSRAPRPHQRR